MTVTVQDDGHTKNAGREWAKMSLLNALTLSILKGGGRKKILKRVETSK